MTDHHHDKLEFVLRNVRSYEEFKKQLRQHPSCGTALDHIDANADGLKGILAGFDTEMTLDVWIGMLIGAQAVIEDTPLDELPQRFQLAMASIAEEMLELFTEEAAASFENVTVEDFM